MSGATLDPRYSATRSAPKRRMELRWSDPRLRAIVFQVLIVAAIAAVIYYFVSNARQHLTEQHVTTGFGYLDRNAGFQIAESPIPFDGAVNSYGLAVVVGVLNTIKVSVIGIVLATVLGTLVGVGRLSRNWLLSRLCGFYVEVVRDIPVLLQLFFWYILLQTALPTIGDFRGWLRDGHVPLQWNPLPGVYVSQRGLRFPALDWMPAHNWALLACAVGIAGTVLLSRRAKARQEETGHHPLVWPFGVLLVLGLPMIVWAALGAPFTLDMPALRGFNFAGGSFLSPEFFALEFGLVVYTAAYIAEIVRSGILAVPKGQWEAAGALGLTTGTTLRRIILPQAMRVVIPPMTSQFLNLTKNTSLAVAIGYADLMSVTGTILNQTGQSPEAIAVAMAVYLIISLSISAYMNWFNGRIALRER